MTRVTKLRPGEQTTTRADVIFSMGHVFPLALTSCQCGRVGRTWSGWPTSRSDPLRRTGTLIYVSRLAVVTYRELPPPRLRTRSEVALLWADRADVTPRDEA